MFKVVICDDERIIREGLKQMIPWGDYHFDTVYTAKDGVEALSLIRQYQPELVITDIRMPRKNGVDLLNDIQNLSCNVIILSSYDDFEYMKAGIQHHVLDYLLKPVDHDQLEAILGTLVETLFKQQAYVDYCEPPCHEAFKPLLRIEYDDYYVNQIIHQIKQHYQSKVTVVDLIQTIDVSESYAMRTFKEHVGITIVDYLNRYRIMQSIRLLNQHYKHYEIADQVGFSEYKMFSYHFKKYLQMSPSYYSKQNHSSAHSFLNGLD
ncbi:response regulator [Staphylococcus felis]|uniref:Response regulator n=1 Tax=Staphylococcus felis TaxID=46127 RepID=A0ABS0QQ78_9STAP|nr:response regulator [Staphylococcus felis]MBH9581416.1 response regulator [Staphylococcus felis]MDM8327514.1 response regulator [Staphylococcus felis]